MKTIYSDYNKSEQEREWDRSCSVARSEAVSYIGIAKKTSGKVTGWLLKKGYPDSIVEKVISDFVVEGVLDDNALAEKFLQSRKDRKAESKQGALQHLIRLGISREIAEKCVNEAFADRNREIADSISLLRLKYKDKIDTIHELEQSEQMKMKQRIFRFLSGKGYRRETVLTAMNIVLKDNMYNDD